MSRSDVMPSSSAPDHLEKPLQRPYEVGVGRRIRGRFAGIFREVEQLQRQRLGPGAREVAAPCGLGRGGKAGREGGVAKVHDPEGRRVEHGVRGRCSFVFLKTRSGRAQIIAGRQAHDVAASADGSHDRVGGRLPRPRRRTAPTTASATSSGSAVSAVGRSIPSVMRVRTKPGFTT